MIRQFSWQAMTHGSSIPRRDSPAFLGAGTVTLFALGVGLTACGADAGTVDGAPKFSGNTSTPAAMQQPAGANTGSTNTGATPTGSNSGSSNSGNTPAAGSQTGSQQTGALPPSNTNTSSPTTPTTPSEGTPTNTPIANGNDANSGGAMAPGAGGATSMPPSSGTTPPATTPPATTPPATTPPATTPAPPTAPDIACPAGATFCSGFESAALPTGVTYQSNPPAQPTFDSTVHHSGSQSLAVTSTAGGFNVSEVVTPIPGQAFWVRLFIQTSVDFGDDNHDSLFVASTATSSQDNNQEHGPEFSEQGNQILLNLDDQLFSAAGVGYPQVKMGAQLKKGTWYCVEASYDGGSGDVELFLDSTSIVKAPGYAKVSYQTFRFGYIEFNTPRTIWFDDVVVAPNRVGCN